MIKNIFFDLDRTLWDFEKNSELVLDEIFFEFNLKEKIGAQKEIFINEYKKINETLWNQYRIGKIKKEFLRYSRFKQTLELFNYYNKNLSIEISDYYVKECPKKKNLFPNTIKILDYLKNKYNLHIITNGFEEVQIIKLKSSGLSDYFDQIITSEKIGVKKPDPKIFSFALTSAKANKANSIMIGDGLKVDILGAESFGIRAVYFNPNMNIHNEKISFEIKNLDELISLF